jgi:hypothetical protein
MNENGWIFGDVEEKLLYPLVLADYMCKSKCIKSKVKYNLLPLGGFQ